MKLILSLLATLLLAKYVFAFSPFAVFVCVILVLAWRINVDNV